ncbi:MAG: hypothetical protein H0W09_00505 [Solirubrobacterales bacterium]|nr:hypothetical protein [Solirubrobacterales bacterium]
MSDQSPSDEQREHLEQAEQVLKPSAEIEQQILFGRLDEATALYAKQAGIDAAAARAIVERLAAEI